MHMFAKPLLSLAVATLLSIAGGALVSADEAIPNTGAATATAPADPAAVPQAATGATEAEVAPDSATGTVEEPAYSPMPAEGPGGGCRHRAAQMPSV